jgi:hypothetical protein
MTKRNIKLLAAMVATDMTLTKEKRSDMLLPLLKIWTEHYEEDFDTAANDWNNMMADIVEQFKLGRH